MKLIVKKKRIVAGEATLLYGLSSSLDLNSWPGTTMLRNDRTELTREGNAHADWLCNGANSRCLHGLGLANGEAHLELPFVFFFFFLD